MGELARQPSAPKLADTPLELLTPRPGDVPSQTWRVIESVAGALSGVGISMIGNMFMRRPVWASLPSHVIFGGLGYFLVNGILGSLYQSRIEEDAVFKHYISLHPEDFPPYERKRWGEIYEPFHPVR